MLFGSAFPRTFLLARYLCTAFRRTMGLTLGEYIHRVRIRTACDLVGQGGRSLAEIGLLAGYRNVQHFSRVFRRLTGLSPGQYRKMGGHIQISLDENFVNPNNLDGFKDGTGEKTEKQEWKNQKKKGDYKMEKLGIQLYTVMEEANKDYIGTIRRLREMGYEGIEFPGGTMEKIAAADMKTLLTGLHFQLAGIVFEHADLLERMEAVLAYCHTCGCDTVVYPWIDAQKRTEAGYREIAASFNAWGEVLHKNGIRFLYHLHGYEFEPVDGTDGWAILLDACNPAFVSWEIDVYWVEWGGRDSLAFVREHGMRSPSLHFKDMKTRKDKEDTEVGSGCLDMVGIAATGRAQEARWFIVEQEAFDMPCMESARISLMNLHRITEAVDSREA